MKGKKFGRLLVLEYSHSKHKNAFWRCKCDCGSIRFVRGAGLRSGTKSCGCLTVERGRERFTKHGYSRNKIYTAWSGMHQRCYNKNDRGYKNYGLRGITVSESWHDIENFINDMYPTYKPGLTLDRIDVNKGYSLDNCRWATYCEQNKNRTISSDIQSDVPYVSYKKGDRRWSAAYRFVHQKNAEEFARRVEKVYRELDDKPYSNK